MKKTVRSALACLLTLCLLITPFSGVLVFAQGAPSIKFSVSNFDYVLPDMPITVTMTANGDATLTACDTRLEGVSIGTDATVSFTPEEKSLANGKYTLVATATDSNGETGVRAVTFVVTDSVDISFHYAADESIVPSLDGATATYHAVTPLDYTVSYGSTADGSVTLTNALPYGEDNTVLMQYYNEPLSNTSSSGIPYQLFDVALNGKTDGEIVVRYTGSTFTGERIALKAYNPATGEWDTLGTITGSDSVSASVDVTTYADNDVIHVMAILDYVINGSDTMIWSTDPQHYTKFEDLYDFYYQVYQYAAEEYTAGNVGYIITTGDLVDDRPNTTAAEQQWQVADQAMSYVDEVGMPNGLVSGNHDVGDFKLPDYSEGDNTTSDYSKYGETFPATRYNDKPWYGGSLNNNTSHYDLVTIGNVDFIILYLGYGVEATDETIAWANDVLGIYNHRTAIIATHQYLDAATADRSPASRAQLIYDEIVDPNSNVKMVICGHDDGSILNKVTASDGRTVYELLADYQFVEAEDPSFYENEHYIGSVGNCCGDGYIRLMTVNGTTLTSETYSPVTGRYNPYGDRESISIDLNCRQPDRAINTTAFSAYIDGEEILTEDAYTTTSAIVITKGEMTTYHHISYIDSPDYPTEAAVTPVDLEALEELIAYAEALDTSIYTDDSVEYLEIVLGDVNAIDKTNASEVSLAYFLLSRMLGAMTLPVEVIDDSTLESVYNYDMDPSKWATSDTVKTALDDMGFKLSRNTTNGWASVNSSEEYSIKSNNGRIYVMLDVDADCAWSIHLIASQANVSGEIVINHAIDKAFNSITCDSMNGVYYGVYDITEAFSKFGMDPSATIQISKTYLYVVPGEGSPQYADLATNPDTVDYRYLEFMTEAAVTDELDYTVLQALIDECSTYDEALYTLGSWKKLQTAITAANEALTDVSLAQADVNLEVIKLQNAIDKLKLVADIIPEPEGSLLPADEGSWVEYEANTSEIYRDENNYTVIQNTNGKWPSVSYTYPEALTYTVADHQLSVDMTVNNNSRVDLLINGQWVNVGKLIAVGKLNGEDMLSGTYTVNIPLSEILSVDTATITATRVYSIGSPASTTAVTIRQMQITDYVAPPYVEEVQLDLMPDSSESVTIVSGDGTATIENGVLTAVNNADTDLRLVFTSTDLFNLEKLNAIHLNINSDIPFKMAYQLVNNNDTTNAAWPNTSATFFSHIFTVENDRVIAGEYDVELELRDNCTTLTDNSAVYFNQFIILLTGQGSFTLNLAEMIKADTFIWPEEGYAYGNAATPDEPFFKHAAQTAPEVEYKFDLLEAIDYPMHPSITQWTSIGSFGLNLEIDISKTPYLYYSFAVPEGGNFTFALYGNSSYCPWLSFLDSTTEVPFINQTAANWDAYTQREQYATTSQTGCIDMRPLLTNPDAMKWIVTQINFYNSTGANVILSYLFFGSEPISTEHIHNPVHFDAVAPTASENGNIEYWYCDDCDTYWLDEACTLPATQQSVILPALDIVVGDIDGDGTPDPDDATRLFYVVNGLDTLTEDEIPAADVNGDGTINLYDAARLFYYVNELIEEL